MALHQSQVVNDLLNSFQFSSKSPEAFIQDQRNKSVSTSISKKFRKSGLPNSSSTNLLSNYCKPNRHSIAHKGPDYNFSQSHNLSVKSLRFGHPTAAKLPFSKAIATQEGNYTPEPNVNMMIPREALKMMAGFSEKLDSETRGSTASKVQTGGNLGRKLNVFNTDFKPKAMINLLTHGSTDNTTNFGSRILARQVTFGGIDSATVSAIENIQTFPTEESQI
jgi:hypothetical protein